MGKVTIIALTSDQRVDAQLHTTGPAGATFTPHVDENGVLSWTNNRGLENPSSVNIMGPKGDPGQKGDPGLKGDPGEVPMDEVNSIVLSTAEALQTAYANIFSGRNLLQDTNKGLNGWTYRSDHPQDVVFALDENEGGIKLSLTTSPSQYSYLQFNAAKTLPKLRPQTRYTLSFDLTTNCTESILCAFMRGDSLGSLTNGYSVKPTGNEGVEHIQVPWTTNDLTATLDTQVVYLAIPKVAGKYWIIKNLKLERGSTSTPWVPAPEDAIAGIPGLKEKTASAFDAAEEFALSNLPVNGGLAPARVSTVTLRAANWTGTASPYSQVVSIVGTTENSKVDLTPTVAQMNIFHQKDLAFVTENDDGVITVYAIGDKPQNDYTIPVTITEVTI